MFHTCMKKASIGQPPAFYLAEPRWIVWAGPLGLSLDLFSCNLAADLRIVMPGFVRMPLSYTFTFTYCDV